MAYIVAHAASPLLLVENAEQYSKIRARRKCLPELKHVVMMAGETARDGTMSWEEFLALGDQVSEREYLERVAALQPESLATLIYTSGTTGAPKGVMLSHANLAWTAGMASELIGMQPDDSLLSYLPLSHILSGCKFLLLFSVRRTHAHVWAWNHDDHHSVRLNLRWMGYRTLLLDRTAHEPNLYVVRMLAQRHTGRIVEGLALGTIPDLELIRALRGGGECGELIEAVRVHVAWASCQHGAENQECCEA